jgi:hypothetical protein
LIVKPYTRQQGLPHRWRRALYGAAVSLVVFALARYLGSVVSPIDRNWFANQIFFMGSPFLALAFLLPGFSSLGLGGAIDAINATFWTLLGATIGLLVRRPLIAVAVWLFVATVGSASVFVLFILGMASGGP